MNAYGYFCELRSTFPSPFRSECLLVYYMLNDRIDKGFVILLLINFFCILDHKVRPSMIRCIYIQIIAPLTIYLRRSFPHHVRCLSVTCSFFFAVFVELVLATDFRPCKKQ